MEDSPLNEYLETKKLSLIEIKQLLFYFKTILESFTKNKKFEEISLSKILIKKNNNKNNELIFQYSYDNNNEQNNNSVDNEYFCCWSLEQLTIQHHSLEEKDVIWSLGIILFYITHKSYPFKNVNTEYLLGEELKKKKPPQLKILMDHNLKNLIKKMLNPEKESRINIQKLYEEPFIKNNYFDFCPIFLDNIENSKFTIINLFILFLNCFKKNLILDLLINTGFFLFRISLHICSSIFFNNDDSISLFYHKGRNLDKLSIPNSIICWMIFTIINLSLKYFNNSKFIIFLYLLFIMFQFFTLIFSISFFNVFENTHKIICVKVVFNYFLCNCYIYLLFFINAYMKREHIIININGKDMVKYKHEKMVRILNNLI